MHSRRVAALIASVALALFIVPFVAGTALAASAKSADLRLNSASKLHIAVADYSVKPLSRHTDAAALGCTQVTYRYSVRSAKSQVGTVRITLRTLPTGTRMVFAQLDSARKPLKLSVSVRGASTTALLTKLDIKPDLTYSTVVGVDKTTGPIGWYALSSRGAPQGSIFAGKAYRYSTRLKRYATGTSTVRVLKSETSAYRLAKLKNRTVAPTFDLTASGDSSQRYLLVTPYSIVDTGTGPSSVASTTAQASRWLDPQGSYSKAPYSIVPFSRDGFVRSLLYMRSNAVLDAYRATGAPLFRDLMLSNLYSLGSIRSTDGLWRTDYTSAWVEGESGIRAPYVDTRHNEGLALHVMHAIDALDSSGVHVADAAAAWPFSYATFLLARSAAGSVTSTGQGFFFADYYDADGLAKVHSSLNHSLGELEYLLAIYARTGNPELLNTALSIKAAVDETGRAWIAPSGDLWYERDLDGTFNGTDYVTVTYLDLLQTQDLLRDLQGSADPVIAELIESKAHWLGIGDDPAGHSVRRRLLDAPAQAGTRQETLR